jgi:tetratricopeptide (TPR) repeat protein
MSDAPMTHIQLAQQARRESRLDEAREHYAAAAAHSRQHAERRSLTLALMGLGQVERDLDDLDAARPFYEEALELSRAEGDDMLLAHTVRHLGDLHHAAARPELAEPCFAEALAIFRKHQGTAPLALANAIRPLAILKTDAGAEADAIALWEEARKYYTEAHIAAGVTECTEALGRLHRD